VGRPQPDLHLPAGRGVRFPLSSVERSVLGFFGAAWLVSLAHVAGVLPLAGTLPLSLYAYYAVAAILGWLAGNVFVLRRRRAGAAPHRRLLVVLYLFGPPSLLYLLRAVAPPGLRAAAPLAALWAFGVYGVFFLVPIVFPPPVPKSR
jgi:hypothetical protein